jgi:hypothetical protein
MRTQRRTVVYRLLCAGALLGCIDALAAAGESGSRISDERVVKIDPTVMPQRPPPLLELGSHLLGSGPLRPGIELPTGMILQPQLTLVGTYRTALQSFTTNHISRSEWANRLDLFGNLALTYTERLVVGVRPLDRRGQFAGRIFQNDAAPAAAHNGVDPYNGNLSTLFFEGDFGEMFPNLDLYDRHSLDYGFSVGRQPLVYQDGLLINDSVDSLGIIRNNVLPTGGSNLQATFVWGWNDVHDGNSTLSKHASLYGLFTQADYPFSTVSADLIYVTNIADRANALFWGISGVQRIRKLSTTIHLVGSHVLTDLPPPAASTGLRPVNDGELLFIQANYTPAWTENNLYTDVFLGIDEFTSAARGPATGGPLGETGILFASFGLGNFNNFGAALSSRPDHSYGAAVGYQIFGDDRRRQYMIEVGGRDRTDGKRGAGQYGLGVRFQQALGRRFVIRADGFRVAAEGPADGWGARLEFVTQF